MSMDIYSLEVVPFAAKELPYPEATFVNQSCNAAGWFTAITRVFPLDVEWCGRCPRDFCNLTKGVCLVMVQQRIADSEAPELRLRELPRVAASDLDTCRCDHGRHLLISSHQTI